MSRLVSTLTSTPLRRLLQFLLQRLKYRHQSQKTERWWSLKIRFNWMGTSRVDIAGPGNGMIKICTGLFPPLKLSKTTNLSLPTSNSIEFIAFLFTIALQIIKINPYISQLPTIQLILYMNRNYANFWLFFSVGKMS